MRRFKARVRVRVRVRVKTRHDKAKGRTQNVDHVVAEDKWVEPRIVQMCRMDQDGNDVDVENSAG